MLSIYAKGLVNVIHLIVVIYDICINRHRLFLVHPAINKLEVVFMACSLFPVLQVRQRERKLYFNLKKAFIS